MQWPLRCLAASAYRIFTTSGDSNPVPSSRESTPGRIAERNGCAPSLSRRRRGIAATDINRLRLPLPDCALPDRSAGRAQQRQRVDHSDDRNHREGQCQSPITPHAARGHQLRKAQVGNHVHCQECR